MTSGIDALCRYAPEAGAALDLVEATAWPVTDGLGLTDLVALAAGLCAEQHGLRPLTPPPGTGQRWAGVAAADWHSAEGLSDAGRTALEFAAQFSLDVSAVSDRQRRELFDHLGKAAADFVAVVFVVDFVPRARAALETLFGPPAGPTRSDDGAPPAPDLWGAFDRFIRAVPRLDALDPVTSELVRLRGARQHRCRLCQSLRSRPALLAGADEDAFGAIDDYQVSRLSAGQKAALAFTDAMIWTPGRIDKAVAGAVIGELGPAQGVELVLDVTRNALNKIAVALAADAPHVEDGVEIYDINARGDLVYGVSLD
jgi:alkylhydroperoxidase family enzyme